MKFVNKESLKTKIESIIETNNLNLSLSDIYLSLINNPEINNPKDFDEFCEYFRLDNEDEGNINLFNNIIKPSIIKIDQNKYLNNPYYKAIKINSIKYKDYDLTYDHFKSDEIFSLKDITLDSNGLEHTTLGYFDTKFSFVTLNKNHVTWMNITPNEIETMESHIKLAKGNVLIMGLGLGYFPFMISLKEGVKSITIIEKDPNIIDLFNKYLLIQFPHKEKIKIINADAFSFNNYSRYDFCFVDLWHNPIDGIEIYLKFKQKEQSFKNCKFSYWLEDGFKVFVRRAAITLLEEQFYNVPNLNYSIAENSFDILVNKLFNQTKNLRIDSDFSLTSFLDYNNLIKLLIG